MIKLLSYKNISQNAELYFDQFRLRHREFIDRQDYDVKAHDGMEFDEYDTLAAQYLVYSEDGRTALGASRLTPVVMGCMLKDHFPHLVDDHALLSQTDVWEGTRFCIDSSLPPEQRRHICQSLALAYVEAGLNIGATHIIGLMPTLILRSVFERSGIQLDRLGAPHAIGAHSRIQAASIEVCIEQITRAAATSGLSNVMNGDIPHHAA
ncbi:acyl-homoserine-lactone synthase [Asticcacaulis sp. YBE204]|uniref:acyl-homoserine-lactone synthase n=1 Tax=Asticcacaulis sp. YBE204 TaxID=1282363 RepID=UPI0003C3DEDE|nr:acyl-homoserine-lactone synthase [Asticcacaulis sp. YBE204]ESQ80500.1 hypothetical protein AEYBE204_04325 [Asticcacaulis sp. YBE204]